MIAPVDEEIHFSYPKMIMMLADYLQQPQVVGECLVEKCRELNSTQISGYCLGAGAWG